MNKSTTIYASFEGVFRSLRAGSAARRLFCLFLLMLFACALGGGQMAWAADPPTTQASNINFTAVTSTQMTLTWTNGNGGERLVVAKAGSAITGLPQDNTGVRCVASTVFGEGEAIAEGEYVVLSENANTVTVTGLSPSITYHFRVFEYNWGGPANTRPAYNTTTATGNPASRTTPPGVVSINRAGATPTRATTLNFTVTFSEAVSGVDATDFALAESGVTGIIGTPTGGPTVWTVPVTSVNGTGTLGLNLVDDDSILSTANSQPLGGTGAGNGNFTGQLYTVDQTPPTPTVTGPSSPTNTTPIFFTITFSEPVTGLTLAGITVTNGSKSNLTGSGAGPYSVRVDPTSNGPVTCQVAASAAVDAVGNPNVASNPVSITYDSTPPTATVTFGGSQTPPPTNQNPILFVIEFDEAVTGLTTAGITVTNGNKGALTGSGSGPYTLSVTPAVAQGTVTCQVIVGAAQDAAGNNNVAASNFLSITYDSVAPTATVTGPPSPTNQSPIVFTISFDESVTGLTEADLTVTGGLKTGSLSGGGSGPYTMSVTPSGETTVTLQVTAGAAQDAAGNGNTASNILEIVFDSVNPLTAVSGPVSPTRNSPIVFTIFFNEPVTGLTADGITVTNGTRGTLTGSWAGPYTLPVTPLGQGEVTCQVQAGAAQDASGNPNQASNLEVIVYDSIAPSISVSGPVSPTNQNPIIFLLTFNEPVVGLTADGITVNNGTKGALSSGSTTYTLAVTPTVAQGSVSCQVQAGAAQDLAGNNNSISNNLSITYDGVSPIVSSVTPTSGTTRLVLPSIAVTFSKPVWGVTADALVVNASSALALTGTAGTAGPYTFSGYAAPPDGTVSVSLAGGTIQDAVGNLFAGLNWTYTIDSSALTVDLESPTVSSGGATNALTHSFTATFTEAVSNFVAGDISVTSGSLSNFAVDSATTYTFDITADGEGAVVVRVPEDVADSIEVIGKKNVASSDFVFTYDITSPTVELSAAAGSLVNAPFTVTAVFSEPVVGLTTPSIALSNATISDFTGSDASYSWTLTPIDQGEVTCQLPAGAAQDPAGNDSEASNLLSVTYDSIRPAAEVTVGGSTTPSPTNQSPIVFSITFTESVTGLTTSGITVSNGAKGELTGSGAGPYTLSVTPTGQGTVACQVNSGAAKDAAGNNNTESNYLTIVYDTVQPTATVSGEVPASKVSPINFIINFSEPVSGLTVNEITVTNGTKGSLSGSGAGPYTLPITPTVEGPVTCQINAGAAQDAAGNGNTVSNTHNIPYDMTPPLPTVNAPASPTNANPILFTISFNEAVVGLTTAGITVTNGTKGVLSGSGDTYLLPVTPGGQGTVTCKVNIGAVQDLAGNSNLVESNVASVVYDSVRPDANIPPLGATLTNASPILFTMSFTKPVTGLTTSGILVTNGVATSVSGSGAGPYTIGVTPTVDQGQIIFQVDANAAYDAAGNGNNASNSRSIAYDAVPPVVEIGAPAVSVTKAGPVDFPITYTGANTINLTAGAVTLNKTGTAEGTVSVLNGGTATPTVRVSDISGDGALGITIAPGTSSDNATNSDLGAGPSATFSVDNTRPTPTVSGPDSPTNISPILFTILFDESVTGLTVEDLAITGGTTTGTLSGAGAGPYSIRVIPTGQGAVACQVNAEGAQDAVGNTSHASNQYSVVYDSIPPSVSIGAPSVTSTISGPVDFLVTYTDAVIVTLAEEHVTLNTTGTAAGTVTILDGGTSTPTVRISGITGLGTIGISIAEDTAYDEAGNAAEAAGPSETCAVGDDGTEPAGVKEWSRYQ